VSADAAGDVAAPAEAAAETLGDVEAAADAAADASALAPGDEDGSAARTVPASRTRAAMATAPRIALERIVTAEPPTR
jgi:hypothetical protein